MILIDYDCVPSTVSWINKYEICNGQTINDQSAIITSTNYPLSQSFINCFIKIETNSPKQKILKLYSVQTELSPKPLNQE